MACDHKATKPKSHATASTPHGSEELNMAIITEVSWDQFVDGHFPQADPFRKAFREAVEAVADKARTALPESNGRIDKAVHLILNSDISIDANGEGTVA